MARLPAVTVRVRRDLHAQVRARVEEHAAHLRGEGCAPIIDALAAAP
jgi:hypothetical protein